VTTTRLLLEQATALLTALLTLGGVLYVSVLAGSFIFDMGVNAADLVAATLATVGLAFEFGCLSLAAGALTGRRAAAIGLASACAVAAYLLYVAGELVESVQPWQPLSPFDQALSAGLVDAGFRLPYMAMPAAAAVFLAAALPVFARRDIAVAH
jgi:ABC-2 type transport system permease protein